MVSDNCFDITGATSAGLPGRISGEQIGGIWNSMAAKNRYQYTYIIRTKEHFKSTNTKKMSPMHPSSGASAVGVMTSNLMAANIV